MQETLQESVNFMKRLLIVAVVLIIFLLCVNYFSSNLASTEALIRDICQKYQQGSMESKPDAIVAPIEPGVPAGPVDPVASEL